jgi:hypothetical protein
VARHRRYTYVLLSVCVLAGLLSYQYATSSSHAPRRSVSEKLAALFDLARTTLYWLELRASIFVYQDPWGVVALTFALLSGICGEAFRRRRSPFAIVAIADLFCACCFLGWALLDWASPKFGKGRAYGLLLCGIWILAFTLRSLRRYRRWVLSGGNVR